MIETVAEYSTDSDAAAGTGNKKMPQAPATNGLGGAGELDSEGLFPY